MRSTAMLCVVALLAIALSASVAAASATDAETVVVDRIEGETAVLLIEADGRTADQRVVGVDELPEDGRHESAVLRVVDGGYVYDESETERRSADAGDRFDRLAGSDDGGEGPFGVCRLGVLGHLGWC